uniref:Ig-like domain-containing protein n=1 Tax=Moschus moschiferus TaxID=68415 RepID=A0A8C6DQG1_MOSMO
MTFHAQNLPRVSDAFVSLWRPSLCLSAQPLGCLSLSGPSRVTGIVGGSLSVKCQYREEFINNYKYWCKPPCVLLWKMMQTIESAREVRRDRMSIRDYPANLTFTVTLESLREEDAGTYWCGINVPLSIDPTFEVEVSVIPGEPCTPLPPPVPATRSPEQSQVGIAKAEITSESKLCVCVCVCVCILCVCVCTLGVCVCVRQREGQGAGTSPQS